MLRMRTRRGGAPAPKGQRCECSSYRCETVFFLRHLYLNTPPFYQDRLGTKNTGKALKKESGVFVYLQSKKDAGEKTGFFGHLYIKMLILPRQARDKHRENSKKEWRLVEERYDATDPLYRRLLAASGEKRTHADKTID
eukprot:COSAG06_NODE_15605_length_1058_cov_7.644421_1_plen_139_part_00